MRIEVEAVSCLLADTIAKALENGALGGWLGADVHAPTGSLCIIRAVTTIARKRETVSYYQFPDLLMKPVRFYPVD